jgi:hypothetical protein
MAFRLAVVKSSFAGVVYQNQHFVDQLLTIISKNIASIVNYGVLAQVSVENSFVNVVGVSVVVLRTAGSDYRGTSREHHWLA